MNFPYCRALLLAASIGSSLGAETSPAAKLPPLQEVMELLRENLTGVTADELNSAAVRAVLREFDSRVDWAPSSEAKNAAEALPAVTKSAVYEALFGYVRIQSFNNQAASRLDAALSGLGSTNQLKGLVLDLRFSNGNSYEEAMNVAGMFLPPRAAALELSGEKVYAGREDPIELPLVVLVNERTVGAAEATAAVLQEKGRALLIGRRTAGKAYVVKHLPIGEGELWVASGIVQFPDGPLLSGRPVVPDIEAAVRIEDEETYLDDPFAPPPRLAASEGRSGDGNGAFPRRRLNEADLIRRMQGEELGREEEGTAEAAVPEQPRVIHDPVLARALDFLKGLTAIQPRL